MSATARKRVRLFRTHAFALMLVSVLACQDVTEPAGGTAPQYGVGESAKAPATPGQLTLKLGTTSDDRIDVEAKWAPVTGAEAYAWIAEARGWTPRDAGKTTETTATASARLRHEAYTLDFCVHAEIGKTAGEKACARIDIPVRAPETPAPTLRQLTLTPDTVALDQGATQQFRATGVMSDGTTTTPPVIYAATGGSISTTGLFTAGSVAGDFDVTVTEATTGMTARSVVTVNPVASALSAPTNFVLALGDTNAATGAIEVLGSWSTVAGAQEYEWRLTASGATPMQTGKTGALTLQTEAFQGAQSYSAGVCVRGLRTGEIGPVTCGAIAIPAASGPAATLTAIVVAPDTLTLDPADTQQFAATGLMSDGSTVAAPTVTWSATGGAVTPAGLYTAGSTPGTFQVIALDASAGRADTAAVTITGTSSPPPTVLTSITVFPGSTSLNPGAAQQFTASGTMSDGSTRSNLAVRWTAGGGSITASGIYTAGGTPGSYAVTATDAASGISGSGTITVNSVAPPPPPPPPGSYTTVASVDFASMTITDVKNLGMFFHESGSNAFDPNPTHGNGPSLALVPDATFGQALRMKQDPAKGWWTVKGRYGIPHTDVVWYRVRVKWEPGYWNPKPPNHKLMFFDWAAGGGSQRIERSSGSFVISASQSLVSFGTAVPIQTVGTFSWAAGHELEPIFDDGEWYEFVMYFGKVGPTEVKTGTFIRRLTRGGVINPGTWQVKTTHYPSTSGTPLPVRSVSLGENLNAAPPNVKFVYYGPWEVVDGTRNPNPYGLAGYLQ